MHVQLSTRNKGEYLGSPMVISTLGQSQKSTEEGVLSLKRFCVLGWTVVAGRPMPVAEVPWELHLAPPESPKGLWSLLQALSDGCKSRELLQIQRSLWCFSLIAYGQTAKLCFNIQ